MARRKKLLDLEGRRSGIFGGLALFGLGDLLLDGCGVKIGCRLSRTENLVESMS